MWWWYNFSKYMTPTFLSQSLSLKMSFHAVLSQKASRDIYVIVFVVIIIVLLFCCFIIVIVFVVNVIFFGLLLSLSLLIVNKHHCHHQIIIHQHFLPLWTFQGLPGMWKFNIWITLTKWWLSLRNHIKRKTDRLNCSCITITSHFACMVLGEYGQYY